MRKKKRTRGAQEKDVERETLRFEGRERQQSRRCTPGPPAEQPGKRDLELCGQKRTIEVGREEKKKQKQKQIPAKSKTEKKTGVWERTPQECLKRGTLPRRSSDGGKL